jgi:hypothetical protein
LKTASPLIAGMALSMALLGCSRPSDADFGKRVQAYLMAHPEVVEAALQKSQDQKTAAADAAARDAIRPMARSRWWSSSITAARTARPPCPT